LEVAGGAAESDVGAGGTGNRTKGSIAIDVEKAGRGDCCSAGVGVGAGQIESTASGESKAGGAGDGVADRLDGGGVVVGDCSRTSESEAVGPG